MIGQNRSMTLAIKGSSGYSLVEFLVAMLILALVSLSWLTIAQVQSANRESYRREAVERLAGMMDVASMHGVAAGTSWCFNADGLLTSCDSARTVNQLFDPAESTLGYRLRVKKVSDVQDDLIVQDTGGNAQELDFLLSYYKPAPVLIGELFEKSGTLDQEEYTSNEKKNVGNRIWQVAVVLGLK